MMLEVEHMSYNKPYSIKKLKILEKRIQRTLKTPILPNLSLKFVAMRNEQFKVP